MSVVWIIDSEQWPRALLRAELIERGFDAVGYITISDALASLPGRAPDAIVLEFRNQDLSPPTIDRLFALGVPIIAIGGIPEINEPVVQEHPWTALLRRPVSIGEIAQRVAALSA